MGLVSLMAFWIFYLSSQKARFKFWLKSVDFEGIKNPLMIDYIAGDFELPPYVLKKLCLKFG